MARVERPEDSPIFGIRRSCKMLQDVAKDPLRTISRQVGENNDDYLVVSVVAVSGPGVPEQSAVAVHKLDNIWHLAVGDLLRSEPKCLTFQGHRHEGTDGPGAAEIL